MNKQNLFFSIAAAKKRCRQETGFVHQEPMGSGAMIPMLENFLYVYALLRLQRKQETIEACLLLRRLLPFYKKGAFPTYLHTFPSSASQDTLGKIWVVLLRIYSLYSAFLGDAKPALEEILSSMKPRSSLLAEIMDKSAIALPSCPTLEEWETILIGYLCVGKEKQQYILEKAEHYLDKEHMMYIGQTLPNQWGLEPAPCFFELFFAQRYGFFPQRLSIDHPVHLKAALIECETIKDGQQTVCNKPFFWHSWGDRNRPYTLSSLVPCKERCFCYPSVVCEGAMECEFYVACFEGVDVLVNGRKATLFQLGDTITIQARPQLCFQLSIKEGQGEIVGHIFKKNRPQQQREGAWDLTIGLRTLARTSTLALEMHYLDCNVGLSTARPMLCSPLSA